MLICMFMLPCACTVAGSGVCMCACVCCRVDEDLPSVPAVFKKSWNPIGDRERA